MKYLSLFSGIGGFELGIQQAYEQRHLDISRAKKGEVQGKDEKSMSDFSSENGNRGEQYPMCIGYSEIDRYATVIYQKHFPDHKNWGDITKINEQELPDFDFLCGGFPCQSFSIAGKRGGFNDTRGTLFFDIARILKAKQPRLLLLENVKGLLSHDQGKTFRTIITTLDELGYDTQWQVLNSKNFGVPQNRERVFIIGHLRGTSRPKVFPFGYSDTKDCKLEVSTKPFISPTLTARGAGEWHSGMILVKSPSIRRLTPKECERLQGFPDDWTEEGLISGYHISRDIRIGSFVKISDTQRYKCLGNAVTVNVIQAIMERLWN